MAEAPLTKMQAIARLPLARLIITSGIGTGLRAGGAGCGLVAYVILARLLDTSELGTVFQAASLAALAASLCCLGIPGLLTRIFSRYKVRSQIGLAWLIFTLARQTALVFCLGAILVAVLATGTIAGLDHPFLPVLLVSATLVPAIVLLRMNGAIAFAHRRPIIGYLPDAFVRPALLMVAAASFFAAGIAVGAKEIVLVMSAIAWATVLFQVRQLRPILEANKKSQGPPRTGAKVFRSWQRAGAALLPASIILSLFADAVILIASLLLQSDEIAVLGVALRLTFLAGFVVQVVMQIVLPDLADASAMGNRAVLKKTMVRAGGLSLATSVASLIFFLMAGRFILGLFGSEFSAGYACLVVLAFAQIARVPGAIATHYLTLNGRQKGVSLVMGAALIVLFLCSAAAVGPFGLTGVGLAVLATQAFISLALCLYAMQRPWVSARGQALQRT